MTKGLLLLSFALVACGGAHRPMVSESAGASYDQVRPIFAKYCSACHPSRQEPDWLNYNSAKPYVDNGMLFSRVVTDKSMPPSTSPQASMITSEERQIIGQWAKRGGPLKAESADIDKPMSIGPRTTPCLECHGIVKGTRKNSKIPILAGQNSDYLQAQLKLFQQQDRLDPSGTMNDLAFGLSAEDRKKIAGDFAKMPGLTRSPRLEDENLATQANPSTAPLAKRQCGSCHFNPEDHGLPSDPLVPVLAGQSKQYLVDQILMFRDGRRDVPLMHELTKNLTYKEIDEIAEFLSNLH